MKMIVAADRNWAIGNERKLLVSIPNDQKMFRLETTGKTVIYGRKTLETFPGQQPLINRKNVILSRQPDYRVKGAVVVHSLQELEKELFDTPGNEIYVIGGESVYRQLLPLCDEAEVTKIDHVFEADRYFPDLDQDPEWELVADSEEQTYFNLEYRFLKYKRKKEDMNK